MKRITMLLLLSLLASGCYVQSLHEFHTSDAVVEIPDLAGDWAVVLQMGKAPTNQITCWTFSANIVDTYDGDNIFSELEVVYFQLDDTRFMDFTAGQPAKGQHTLGNAYWNAGITPVHSLCKLILADDTLTLIPLDLSWFDAQIKDGTLPLPHIKPNHPNANYIFTATPGDWTHFLRTHKDNNEVFNPKFQFTFQRKANATE